MDSKCDYVYLMFMSIINVFQRSMRDTIIDRAIGVCKKVIAAFSISWKKKKALGDAQEQLKLPQHKLISHQQDGAQTAHD